MKASSIIPAHFQTLIISLSELCQMATRGCRGNLIDNTSGTSHEFSDVPRQPNVPRIIGISRYTEVTDGIRYALTLQMAIPAQADNRPLSPAIRRIPIRGKVGTFRGIEECRQYHGAPGGSTHRIEEYESLIRDSFYRPPHTPIGLFRSYPTSLLLLFNTTMSEYIGIPRVRHQ